MRRGGKGEIPLKVSGEETTRVHIYRGFKLESIPRYGRGLVKHKNQPLAFVLRDYYVSGVICADDCVCGDGRLDCHLCSAGCNGVVERPQRPKDDDVVSNARSYVTSPTYGLVKWLRVEVHCFQWWTPFH
ncbi:hypothetical protein Ddc_08003 [Ditylenchus destructor]|nr:hypothetical protein Ddc_08003 [Ditylenchus destructor]